MGFTDRLSPDSELELPEAADLTPAERLRLEKKLARIEKELDKVRAVCAELSGRNTQRNAKAQRAWDELAKEKARLISILGLNS